ncbi:HAD-IA family hydrolase [bacterium]|nr:HAD-IA family hydrolase [bacterium]
MIEALFLDVGGVLGTNGWGRDSRKLACQQFNLPENEVDERHRMTFDAYEIGKLSLAQYLERTIFYQPRNFSQQDFVDFMISRSQPYPDMIEFVKAIKRKYSLKVSVVSNEGRELTIHRVQHFGLREFVDAFIFSCFARFRKPDPDIFSLALNVSLHEPERILYVDDRSLFVEVAQSMGMKGCVHDHTRLDVTRQAFASHGLSL